MRVAITGATGFVGSHLAMRLLSEGHEVVRLARRTRTDEDVIIAPLDDVERLTEAFSGVHAVAHCARIHRVCGDPTYQRVHVAATRNVVEAARRAGIEKIVLIDWKSTRLNSSHIPLSRI